MPNSNSQPAVLSENPSAAKAKPHPDIPHIGKASCAQVTKSSQSNFIAAFRFLPREKMEALIKVYAFFRIADDCVDELQNPEDKEQALNYWESELQKIYQKQPAHPIMEDLRPVLERFQIPLEYLTELMDGCRMDIHQNCYQTFDELQQYCYKVASLVGLTCLKIFEYDSPNAKQMAIDLGLAFQFTNIIRDISDDLKMNRIYIAKEDMLKCGYTEEQLLNRTVNSNFKDLMKMYSDRALAYYQAAEKEFPNDKKNKLIAAKAMDKVYKSILFKIIKEDFPVFTKRTSLSSFKKFTLLFPLYLKSLFQK